MSDKLTKVIDDLVEQRTFSVEAAEGIAHIRANAIAFEIDLAQVREELRITREAKVELAEVVIDQRDELNAWAKRLGELTEREAKIHGLETSEAVQAARASVAIDMFKTVFKPFHMRKAITGQAVSPNEGGYASTTIPTYGDETTDEE